MKAFRFQKWLEPAELIGVDIPEPGPGEALIRIGGAGACHSDLHIMYEWTPENYPIAHWQLPFTLGHENAGWIEGGDSGSLDVGTPVVIPPTWSCGVCASCRRGATNYCEKESLLAGGLGRDGGMAEYMVAPTEMLIALRDLKPWQAAPLTDAGLTAYHAVKRCLPLLTPDATAVVIGVGGLGHMAIEFLREFCGSQVIAVDMDEKALKMASELGAHLILPSNEQTAAEIRKATRDLGAMVILDFVGIDATMEIAAQSARRQGQIVVVGIGGGTLPFRFGVLPYGCSLVTTMGLDSRAGGGCRAGRSRTDQTPYRKIQARRS